MEWGGWLGQVGDRVGWQMSNTAMDTLFRLAELKKHQLQAQTSPEGISDITLALESILGYSYLLFDSLHGAYCLSCNFIGSL